jgi:uncharacterized protein YyaL (SSP411 family)
MLDVKAAPAVFNTGQVLFGWTAAYAATGDKRYARSAAAASRWLVNVQSEDGAWRRDLSVLTTSSVQTFNARAAWGLAIAGREFDEPRWQRASLKNCEWVVAQQQENGWFGCNGFSNTETPLLHTIGYVLEGLLGVGELLDREKYVRTVVRGIEPLVEIYERSGSLKGRYNQHWYSTVSWRCLTGEAQIAVVLFRLARLTGEKRYAEVAACLLEDVARIQDIESRYPESLGAIPGSYPLWGSYAPFNYLNWAAKFFIDALLLYLNHIDVQQTPERREPSVAA